MIFYFSATGNSRHVAERLAAATNDHTVSIASCMKEHNFSFALSEKEKLGIVVPVYWGGLPTIVVDFFEQLKIEKRYTYYVYTVLTHGGLSGFAGKQLGKLFSKINIPVNAQFSVKMVDNTAFSKLSDKAEIKTINEAAEIQIDEIIKLLNDCSSGNFDKMKMSFIGPPIYKLYKWARQAKRFRVLDKCTGCSICVNQCPINAIEIKNKKVAWKKSECVMCLGCLHHCPQFAIRYLRVSDKQGQYLYQEE